MATVIKPISSTVTTATFVSVGSYTMATGVTGFALEVGVANTSTSNQTALVNLTRNDGSTNYYIVRNLPIPPQAFVSVISVEARKAMASGYSLQASVFATTTSVDITASVQEFS